MTELAVLTRNEAAEVINCISVAAHESQAETCCRDILHKLEAAFPGILNETNCHYLLDEGFVW